MNKSNLESSAPASQRLVLRTELEQVILGTFMITFSNARRMIHKLDPAHFSVEMHQKIAKTILQLFMNSKAVDLMTVCLADKTIDPSIVTRCTRMVVTDTNLEEYMWQLLQYHMSETIETIAVRMHTKVRLNADPFEIIANAQSEMTKLITQNTSGAVSTQASVNQMAFASDEIGERPPGAVPSGLKNFDSIVHYFMPGDVHIIAGRPGMGKTALALTMCRNQVMLGFKPVLFSLEMNKQQIAARQLAFESGYPVDLILKNKLNANGRYAVQKAAETLPHFLIDDDAIQTDMSFRSQILKLKSQGLIDIAFIDYIQLMRSSEKTREMSREVEISAISRALKITAKEANIPIVALAQLSRAVESRGGDKRPQLSDLRESGSIEQDASLVIFTYRPEYYGIQYDRDNKSLSGVGIGIIAKNRNGALDDIVMGFRHHTTMWYDKNIEEIEDFNQQQTSDEF